MIRIRQSETADTRTCDYASVSRETLRASSVQHIADVRLALGAMLALSIQQPWAWLIVSGHKDIENRDWPTNVRGRFLVHAGKKLDDAGLAWIRRNFPQIELPTAFDRGGIVGEARIVDCVQDSDSPWFVGDYGFVLRDAKPLPFQPVRGQLGFFKPAATPAPEEGV